MCLNVTAGFLQSCLLKHTINESRIGVNKERHKKASDKYFPVQTSHSVNKPLILFLVIFIWLYIYIYDIDESHG